MAMNNNAGELDALRTKYLKLRRALPRKLAITAVNFFKRNFRLGGYVDTTFTKWKDSHNGRTTMVKTGNLRRAIKKIYVTANRIVVGVAKNIPYARIHNEGGTVPITPKMRRYFWAMYKKTGQDKYKWMAITKKTHIEIPKRQFIGDDNKAIEKTLERQIIKEFKTLRP